MPRTLTGIDAVIFGHSHKYFEQTIGGRLWLNPCSCGKRRFDQEITLAILTLPKQHRFTHPIRNQRPVSL